MCSYIPSVNLGFPPGQTGCYTPHMQTLRMNQRSLIYKMYYIPQFLPIPLQTTYVFCPLSWFPFAHSLLTQKPIVAVLVVPTSTNSAPSTLRTSPPTVQLPSSFTPSPDRLWVLKRYIGRSFDRIIGLLWTVLWLIGLGNAVAGMASFVFGILAWRWMSTRSQSVPRPDGEA